MGRETPLYYLHQVFYKIIKAEYYSKLCFQNVTLLPLFGSHPKTKDPNRVSKLGQKLNITPKMKAICQRW
jgi:hypothetical protein